MLQIMMIEQNVLWSEWTHENWCEFDLCLIFDLRPIPVISREVCVCVCVSEDHSEDMLSGPYKG